MVYYNKTRGNLKRKYQSLKNMIKKGYNPRTLIKTKNLRRKIRKTTNKFLQRGGAPSKAEATAYIDTLKNSEALQNAMIEALSSGGDLKEQQDKFNAIVKYKRIRENDRDVRDFIQQYRHSPGLSGSSVSRMVTGAQAAHAVAAMRGQTKKTGAAPSAASTRPTAQPASEGQLPAAAEAARREAEEEARRAAAQPASERQRTHDLKATAVDIGETYKTIRFTLKAGKEVDRLVELGIQLNDDLVVVDDQGVGGVKKYMRVVEVNGDQVMDKDQLNTRLYALGSGLVSHNLDIKLKFANPLEFQYRVPPSAEIGETLRVKLPDPYGTRDVTMNATMQRGSLLPLNVAAPQPPPKRSKRNRWRLASVFSRKAKPAGAAVNAVPPNSEAQGDEIVDDDEPDDEPDAELSAPPNDLPREPHASADEADAKAAALAELEAADSDDEDEDDDDDDMPPLEDHDDAAPVEREDAYTGGETGGPGRGRGEGGEVTEVTADRAASEASGGSRRRRNRIRKRKLTRNRRLTI